MDRYGVRDLRRPSRRTGAMRKPAGAGLRAVDRLVDEALVQGGSDNITVVLIGRG